jgi:hypothetical protein
MAHTVVTLEWSLTRSSARTRRRWRRIADDHVRAEDLVLVGGVPDPVECQSDGCAAEFFMGDVVVAGDGDVLGDPEHALAQLRRRRSRTTGECCRGRPALGPGRPRGPRARGESRRAAVRW